MEFEEIMHLPIGTRIRGKLGLGIITENDLYGKGVKLDGWPYLFPDDIHAFGDRSRKAICDLVAEVIA